MCFVSESPICTFFVNLSVWIQPTSLPNGFSSIAYTLFPLSSLSHTHTLSLFIFLSQRSVTVGSSYFYTLYLLCAHLLWLDPKAISDFFDSSKVIFFFFLLLIVTYTNMCFCSVCIDWCWISHLKISYLSYKHFDTLFCAHTQKICLSVYGLCVCLYLVCMAVYSLCVCLYLANVYVYSPKLLQRLSRVKVFLMSSFPMPSQKIASR